MYFTYATTITLFDTDASGLLFYGSLFRLTQSCFEAFLRHKDLPIAGWINGSLPALPVRRLEAEYRSPLRVGAAIEVVITDISIGTSSLTVTYSVIDTASGTTCATACITHVAVDLEEMKTSPIPPDIAEALVGRTS
jgi:acyl-CoA thioesterase FadM